MASKNSKPVKKPSKVQKTKKQPVQKAIPEKAKDKLLAILEARFRQHLVRHPKGNWETVRVRLEAHPEKLWSLYEMERTGGEPDLVEFSHDKNELIFCDCSPESPSERRSLCYDQESLDTRKEAKPSGNVLEMAETMGVDLLTEEQYRKLQDLGVFDAKTSSWIKTPESIRALGGALFCDRRYNQVFVYHNGASSYYGARGFRALLRI